VPIHTSLCLDAISYHSISKEAVLFLLQLKSSVTRIVSELKFFHRTFSCGYRHSAVFQSTWCSQFLCTVICWYMSSHFKSFCVVILEPAVVPSASSELTSVAESSQMCRTLRNPIAVCAIAATSQCSHFFLSALL
jgi:hypothetical protein